MCVHIPVTVLFPILLFQHQVHRAVINLKIKMVWYQTDYWKFSCQWCHPMPFYWSLWENWHWQAQQCSTSWTLATKNSVITARNKNKKVCAQGVLQGVMYTYDYIWAPYKLWKYTHTHYFVDLWSSSPGQVPLQDLAQKCYILKDLYWNKVCFKAVIQENTMMSNPHKDLF